MLAACEPDTVNGARDHTVLLAAYECGIRRSEIVELDMLSFRREDLSLVVRGKGNVMRVAFLPVEAAAAISRGSYIAEVALDRCFCPSVVTAGPASTHDRAGGVRLAGARRTPRRDRTPIPPRSSSDVHHDIA